jgi:hypothetical protein
MIRIYAGEYRKKIFLQYINRRAYDLREIIGGLYSWDEHSGWQAARRRGWRIVSLKITRITKRHSK